MIKIYICEDNDKQRENLVKCVNEILKIEESTMDMCMGMDTENPYELLKNVEVDTNNCIFFLDIDLNQDMNGLELAIELRKKFPRCYIVFLTSHSEMAYMTFNYKVEAMDFIIKDNPLEIKNRVYQCMLHACELEKVSKKNMSKGTFTVRTGSKVKEIPYDEILFFQASSASHKLILQAESFMMEFNGRIKDLENSLNDNFYKSHRAYVVNVSKIDHIADDGTMIFLNDGSECPLAVRQAKGLKNKMEKGR